MWSDYLKARCQSAWLREVKTHHLQSWLEEIAKEHEISKTTVKHVKNFLSGVFRHAAQQGFFDGARPVRLAEVPAFAPNGGDTKPYSLEEIGAMLQVLSEPAATAVAAAAFTGLRLGEVRVSRESYEPAQDEESLGWLNVTRSVWRSTGDSGEGEHWFQREAKRCSGEGEQRSERRDAGRLIVPESVSASSTRPSEGTRVSRSEAEELRRGFGVRGKGAAAPLSPASLCRGTEARLIF